MMSDNESNANLFTGRWVGETQGVTMAAHIWEISRQGNMLLLNTRWEGRSRVVRFQAQIVDGEQAFMMGGSKSVKATLIDKQHFIIPGWCTNDARNGEGPDFDVVFSRPGIAELTAGQAYAKYLETIQKEGSPANRTTSPKGK
jgi:hypothetical protein